MLGLCSGKIRSTPTPRLILRTVKVSESPAPRRPATMPWKIWERSFSPSITRTCTLTVSPGRKSEKSFLRCGLSTDFTRSMGLTSSRSGLVLAADLRKQALLFLGQFLFLEQILASLERPPQRFLPAMPLDQGVVAREQHLRHLHAAIFGRTGIVRAVEAPLVEGIAGRAFEVAQDS